MPLHNLSNFGSDSNKKNKNLNFDAFDEDIIKASSEPYATELHKKFKKIEDMTFEEQVNFAKESILYYLTRAPRTRKQLQDKLNDRGYSEEASVTALNRMEEVGVVNDKEFARLWVNARHFNAKLAPFAIKRELLLKGVSEEIVNEELAKIEEESLITRAREIGKQKIRTVRGDRNSKISKIAAAIARKGYTSAIAFSVAKELVAEEGDKIDDIFLDSGEE